MKSAYADILTGRQRLAGWPADKLVAMAFMRTLVRGDWVSVSAVTVVVSYTEGPDGAAVGGENGHLQYFITAKPEQRDNASVKMTT